MSSPQIAQEKCKPTPNLSNGKLVNLELRNFNKPTNSTLRDSDYEAHRHHSTTVDPFPAEIDKTVLCFFLMSIVLTVNLISTSVIHDQTPNKFQTSASDPSEDEKLRHPPLRDISFDFSSRFTNEDDYVLLLSISEVILIVTTVGLCVLLIFHRHKSIIFRRLFFLVGLLFSVRLLTMNATLLPISSSDDTLYQCSPKQKSTALDVLASRLLSLASKFGLAFSGNLKFCGNYIYSGHTVMLILNSLMVDEYCPFVVVSWLVKLMTVCSTLLILVSRYDYTISVIIAYYATTRVFWLYHTLANNPSLKKFSSSNQICKEWWYPVFQFLEGNVKDVVPSSYTLFR